ncbi:glycosyltransferase WbuB [bacterium]|nr:MAG: glycosyltransferase WbuB [bacterium]
MKIVYFNYLYDLYGMSLGSTRKAEQLMNALSAFGYDIRMYWMKPQYKISGKTYVQVRSTLKRWLSSYLHDPKQLFSNVNYVIREWRILDREKPDLVISRLDMYLFSSFLLCKVKRIPLIIEADAPGRYEIKTFCPEFRQMERLAKWIENKNLNGANISICVSHEMRKYFIREGTRPEKIVVVSNGADIQHFSPDIRHDDIIQEYGLQDKIVIGFSGSFSAWHGVENLMKVMGHVLTQYSDSAFLLIGQGGAMRQQLNQWISQNKFQTRVILIDYVDYDRIPAYLACMDICLALYPNLSFFYFSPVKVYEYMASGKAVVATRIGQIEEIIQHRENGMLCNPEHHDDMIHILEELIENPSLRSKLGRSARKSVEQNHTWKHKAEAWSNWCERVVHHADHP